MSAVSRVVRVWLCAWLAAAALLLVPPSSVKGQPTCAGDYDTPATACDLGSPDAQGINVRGTFDHVGQLRVFRFRAGREPATVHVFLGDLYYPADMTLWRGGPAAEEFGRLGLAVCDRDRGCLAEARRFQRRVVQFVEPSAIVERVDPGGSYLIVVKARDDPSFDPSRGFTLRVALSPPVCGADRDPDERYLLTLAIEPDRARFYDLLSFTVFMSPPFADLFDFDWQIDGQAVAAGWGPQLQRAATDLPRTSGEHRVRVTARGARPYPDPDQPEIPPTISLECPFRVT